MTTFAQLLGFGFGKTNIVYGGGGDSGGGGGGSDDGGGRSESAVQADINSALSASGGEWTSELNDLVAERDVARSAPAVSSTPSLPGPDDNNTRQSLANTFTPNDGMEYRGGVLYNESDGSRVTTNTPAQDAMNTATPYDAGVYKNGQLEYTNNSTRMNLANDLTPNDGMEYRDGVLYNDDGSQVTENTPWQNLTNLATLTDGQAYTNGQIGNGVGLDVGNIFDGNASATTNISRNDTSSLFNDIDNESDNISSVGTATETATGTTTGTATGTTTGTTGGNNLADDLSSQIAALEAQLASLNGGTTEYTNTQLPGDYLTEEALARYLADLDLGSKAYDPAAFMNAYGFALDPSAMGDLIGTYQNDSGMYQRRAVKDRETGEIRYVNVPIGAGATNGNNGVSQFRNQRRTGFGQFV